MHWHRILALVRYAMYNCWIRKSNYVQFEWFVAENRCRRRNSSAGLKRRKWTEKIRFARKCAGLQGCWINKCRIREGRLYCSITCSSLVFFSYRHNSTTIFFIAIRWLLSLCCLYALVHYTCTELPSVLYCLLQCWCRKSWLLHLDRYSSDEIVGK